MPTINPDPNLDGTLSYLLNNASGKSGRLSIEAGATPIVFVQTAGGGFQVRNEVGTVVMSISEAGVGAPIDGSGTAGFIPKFTDANTIANSLLSDDATNVSLASGQLLAPLGAVGTPTYSFTGDANTGLYSPGADQVSLVTNGVAQLALTTTTATFAGVVRVPFGVVGGPGISFDGDGTTGFYRSAASTIGVAVGGVNNFTFASAGLTALTTAKFLGIASAGSTSFAFAGDTTTGISRQAAGGIGFLQAGNLNFYLEVTGTTVVPQFRMGTGTGFATLIGRASANYVAVGNVGAGEDDLMTYSLPASSFTNAGSRNVRIKAWGTTANNANAKTLKIYFGTQLMATLALTVAQAGRWVAEAVIGRTGSSTQDFFAEAREVVVATGAYLATTAVGTGAQDDTAAITIKCTGEATADNDITQEGMLVDFATAPFGV